MLNCWVIYTTLRNSLTLFGIFVYSFIYGFLVLKQLVLLEHNFFLDSRFIYGQMERHSHVKSLSTKSSWLAEILTIMG